jgi:hypothetical protein
MYTPSYESLLDEDMLRHMIANVLRDQNHMQEVPRGNGNVTGDVRARSSIACCVERALGTTAVITGRGGA